MTDDDEMRALARRMFNPGAADAAPQRTVAMSNTVPGEGANPGIKPTAEEYSRDFTRRMFDDNYAAVEPHLPEED